MFSLSFPKRGLPDLSGNAPCYQVPTLHVSRSHGGSLFMHLVTYLLPSLPHVVPSRVFPYIAPLTKITPKF